MFPEIARERAARIDEFAEEFGANPDGTPDGAGAAATADAGQAHDAVEFRFPADPADATEADLAYLRETRRHFSRLRDGDHPRGIPGLRSAAFARFYFPHLCGVGFSPMHHAAFRRHDALARAAEAAAAAGLPREGARMALAAPRGAAKSTVHSLMLPLMDVCLRRERYIVLLSATLAQARARLRNIRAEISGNARLRADFGAELRRGARWSAGALVAGGTPETPAAAGGGRAGRGRTIGFHAVVIDGGAGACAGADESIVAPAPAPAVLLEAYGAGSELRGLGHGASRPTRIILDDVEATWRARRADHRERLLAWYDEVVENLGDATTCIEVVGTILHRDGLLARLLGRPGFHAARHAAVLRFADRADLWERWRALLCDPADPRAATTAAAFLRENRAAMMAGARALWPARESYASLMTQLATRGRAAFWQEKMNEPLAGAGRLFDTARWHRFDLTPYGEIVVGPPPAPVEAGAIAEPEASTAPGPATRRLRLSDTVTFGFLDPALGRAGRSGARGGDHAALATVARDADGRIYLIDLWMEPATPAEQARRVYEKWRVWGWTAFAYESNGFQAAALAGPLRDQAILHRADAGPGSGGGLSAADALASAAPAAALPVRLVNHSLPKEVRIATLEPLAATGALLFHRALPEPFLAQADDYPASPHDDGLDALAGAVALARNFAPQPPPARPISPRINRRDTRGY